MSSVEGQPPLFLVKGDATPEEVAALAAVLAAEASAEGPAPRRVPPRQWAAPQRAVRPAVRAVPGGWRSSALPG